MKRTKLKKMNPKVMLSAEDDIIKGLYKIRANYVNCTYLSVIDNGDQNIQVRLTFVETMRLNGNITAHEPSTAVVMNISDFIKFYNLATLQLQNLREAKKIP